MPESFDPYYKWLGIPPQEQPPHAYRLLAVQVFETDLDVIEAAAEQRMALLRTRQTGAQSNLSQKLLNEVSAARVILLNPEKKAAYDAQLRAKQAAAQAAAGPKQLRTREATPVAKALPVAAAVTPGAPQPAAVAPELRFESGDSVTSLAKKKSSTSPVVFAALGAGILVIGGLAFLFMRNGNTPSGEQKSNETIAQRTNTPDASPSTVATSPVKETANPTKEEPEAKPPGPAEEKVVVVTPEPKEPSEAAPSEKVAGSDSPGESVALPEGTEPAAGAQPWPFESPTVDLLARARELPADALMGWTPGDGSLTSPPTGDARLTLAEKPVDSYKLSFEVERTSGDGPVAIGFPILGRQFVYVFDGMGGGHNGLDGWEGKSYSDNPSTRAGNLLTPNKRAKIDIEARLDQLTVLVDGKVVFNEQLVFGPWRTLHRSSLTTERGSKLKQLEDGSYLLQRPFPQQEVYTVEAPANGLPVAAIRVEALPEASLPSRGPGTADNGNFVLSKVDFAAKTTAARSQDFQKFPLVKGLVDYFQNGFGVEDSLQENDRGWAVFPSAGARRVAVFLLERPTTPAAAVRIKMHFLSQWGIIARFRLSVANSLTMAQQYPFSQTTENAPIERRWQAEQPSISVVTGGTSIRLASAQISRLGAEIPRRPIDVLAKIDIARDRVAGDWARQENALQFTAKESRLQLPIALVPDAYRLSVRVQRNEGSSSVFGIGFVARGSQGLFIIDLEGATGLHLLDGQSFSNNKSTYRGQVFEPGKNVQVDLTVRGNHVLLVADGKTICDWQGDPTQLKPEPYWAIYDLRALYVGGTAPHVIRSIEFTPLGSAGAATAGVASSQPIDVLKKIDTNRDRVAGNWGIESGKLVSIDRHQARLKLPISSIPNAYKLHLRVKRNGDPQHQAFCIGFVMQGRYALYCVDYNQSSGLHRLAGLDCGQNETAYHGQVFEPGKEVQLDLVVAGNRIRVFADGKTLCDWQGDPDRIDAHPRWDVQDKQSLYVGSDGAHEISAIQFTPYGNASPASADSLAGELPGEIAGPKEELLPPPTSDELLAARKAMREKYADIFAEAKTPEEKFKLGESLIQQGQAQLGDPLERYVLLEEARTLGEDLGNYQLTVKAIDALAKMHEINRGELTASAFLAAIKKVKTPAENAAAARTGLNLIDQLVEANMDAAESIRRVLPALAAKARDGDLLRDVKDASANLTLRKKLYDAYLAAEETLKKDPQDKTANLAAGTYLAVCTEDSEHALEHLSLTGDEKLAALAKSEAEAPKDATVQLELADQWQAWATAKGHEELKSYALECAVRWYGAAMPSLAGLQKAKAEKDLADVRASLEGGPKMTKSGSVSGGRTLLVVDARYGVDTRWLVCTKEMSALVRNGRLVASSCSALVDGDPAPGVGKTARITVQIGGNEFKREYAEAEPILIEAPGRKSPRPASRNLTILDACVGAGVHWADVKNVLQSRVQANRLALKVDASSFAGRDVAFRTPKFLFLEWSYNGEQHTEFFRDFTDISIGAEK